MNGVTVESRSQEFSKRRFSRRFLCAAVVCGIGTLLVFQVWLFGLRLQTRPVETLQCGQWCVLRASQLLGLPVSVERVVEVIPYEDLGHPMLQIRDGLNRLGFDVKPVRTNFQELMSGPLPIILHLTDPDHYVVAVQADQGRVQFFDAMGQRRRVLASRIESRISGYALRISRPANGTLPPERTSAAKIQFDTLYVDQGDVPQGFGSLDYRFPFTNSGERPVVIHRLTSDCACLRVAGPDTVMPGDTAEITATFSKNPDIPQAFFMHSVRVESNDTDFPVITLIAAGNLSTSIRVSPFQVVTLNPKRPGQRRFLSVNYTGDDPQMLDRMHATTTHPGISVKVLTAEEYRRRVFGHLRVSGWSGDEYRIQRMVEVSLRSDTDFSELPTKAVIVIQTEVSEYEHIEVPCVLANI